MLKCLLLLLIVGKAMSANVLFVSLIISHSHHYWIEPIALELANRGHNVTFLSLDSSKVKKENYTLISLEGIYDKFALAYSAQELQQTTFTPWSIPPYVNFMYEFYLEVCKMGIEHPTIHQTLLSYPKDFKFDLILWDHIIGDCMLPLVEHFGNPPVIGLSPYGLFEGVDQIYGGHFYAYVGSVTMPFYEPKTTYARLLNAINIFYAQYVRKTWYKTESIAVSKKYFPKWSVEKYEEIQNLFSVVLLNWNSVVNHPQPLPLNMIPIGGVQINMNERLNKYLQEIYSIPSKGVIFFSLGSNVKSEDLSSNILQSMADCFEEIPNYQIVWKIKPVASLKLPSNVHHVSWAPQHAILNQSQTKLFITHGGGLSSHETTYFGIPVVLIPILLDQFNNAEKLQSRGCGEILHLNDLHKAKNPKDVFCSTVKQVLFTENYTTIAKTLSTRYRDQQNSPMETAVYWVEYILRHGGAKHLGTVERHQSGFYSQNLDIYLVVVLMIGVMLGVVVLMLNCVCSSLFRRDAKKEKSKKA